MARSITVDFLGNDKTLGRTISDVDGKTGRLGSTFKKVGLLAGALLAGGVILAGKALWDAGKAAAADQAAQEQLAVAMRNNAGASTSQIKATEDWISAQGRALGVTDDELRPALGRLVTATKDVGEAQKLASLAMDVSAGTGKSLESVSTALMKAQNGQVSALSRLGINTKNAAGETITMEQAVKRMSDTFGGQAAKRAGTLQGKMDRLKLIFDETKEAIGARLLPVALKLSTWFLNEGLPAIQSFGRWLDENLTPIFARVGEVFRRVTGSMSGDASSNISKVREALAMLASIFRDAVSIVRSLWNRFGAYLLQYGRSTMRNLIQIFGGALQMIQGVFKVFSSLLKGDWRGVWQGIRQILAGAWKVITGLVKQGLNMIRLLVKVAWSIIRGITAQAWNGIKALPGLALRGMLAVIRANLNLIRSIWRTAWDAVRTLARTIWSSVTDIVRNGANNLVDAIRAIPGRLRGLISVFGSAGRALIGAFIDGMRNASGIVSGIAGNVWSAVKSLLNSAIGRLRSALNFTIGIPGPDISVNVGSSIPYLARGTRSHRGGWAVVGEEGAELVNLPRGSRVIPHRQSLGALRDIAGGGMTIIKIDVRGVLTESEAGRAIERILAKLVRQRGVPLQVRTVS